MFYKLELKDHIRVNPNLFGLHIEDAITKKIRQKYNNYISQETGIVIDVAEVKEIGEGIIIPGDGASYYEVKFDLFVFKPEMQEVLLGNIRDITDFGAFISLGPTEGMAHISQTMDDFVSFSKDRVLSGKDSHRVLKVGDICRSRIIAVSFKESNNPKIGLTMRQPRLGKLEWLDEVKEVKKVKEVKEEKKSKRPVKGK